ncbi:ParA family protein [Endozoicomonas gorgoniicola]|uniref:ParA family protein n=1 Tax=Endozoicomonas gorgoniicola TaxID=1234144 RepID=A0ABT3N193_9GAMM|nr:ParA family protein [Endozoicomonas gorgoniicola]MCW7555394.1 ParA family protein [Endozoicomonas gorgoniicola]
MGKILAVTNQKGGVGKTTSCVNLSASLVASKRRVLLIDLDPQGNATMGSGVNKHDLELSSYHVLTGRGVIDDVIVHSEGAGYDILPTNSDLTAAEVELMNLKGKETRLRDALKRIQDRYDFIMIDCPPSLNMLTLNALVAAEGVIIPMQCEYYALEGLTALMETITGVRQTLNPRLHIEGLLRTMYDPRISLTNEVSRQLISHFGDQVYRTVIPRNVRLAEAPSHGKPVLAYDKNSRGAIAYLALAGEMIRRHDIKFKTQREAVS